MFRIALLSAIAVVGAALLPLAGNAQDRSLLLRHAWHDCLQYVRDVTSPSPEGDFERIAQFKACMAQRQVIP